MKEIIKKYDYFFFDLWGVLYNGKKISKNALNILTFIHKQKKNLLLFQIHRNQNLKYQFF